MVPVADILHRLERSCSSFKPFYISTSGCFSCFPIPWEYILRLKILWSSPRIPIFYWTYRKCNRKWRYLIRLKGTGDNKLVCKKTHPSPCNLILDVLRKIVKIFSDLSNLRKSAGTIHFCYF